MISRCIIGITFYKKFDVMFMIWHLVVSLLFFKLMSTYGVPIPSYAICTARLFVINIAMKYLYIIQYIESSGWDVKWIKIHCLKIAVINGRLYFLMPMIVVGLTSYQMIYSTIGNFDDTSWLSLTSDTESWENFGLAMNVFSFIHDYRNTVRIIVPLWEEPPSLVDSPHKGRVMWSFNISIDVNLNKLLNKQWGWWCNNAYVVSV